MTHRLKRLALATVPVVVLSGCVDNNYDLSDVDTTTRITVNDLVIPVNIDEIKLSDILDIDADSKIKVVTIGGKEFYALSETGSFSSDAIYVEKITADAPVMDPTSRTLSQVMDEERSSRAASSENGINTYRIEEMGNDFDYDAGRVDDAITEVYSVKVEPMRFNIHLTAIDVEDSAEKIYFKDLVISMPKGMTATASVGDYDPATGLWTIGAYEVRGHTADAYLMATAIDLRANGCHVSQAHTLVFSSSFRVKSGILTVEARRDASGDPVQLPETLEFRADYTLNDLTVNAFTGVINYTLKGMDIEPVEISDIPDFFNDPETNLLLENPQLYLQLNNPVAANDLMYQCGLQLHALRNGAPVQSFEPVSPFKVGYGHGVAGPYNIVMAPDPDALTTPDDFSANLDFISFPTLGNLLGSPENAAVKGLPSRIDISVVSPQIPAQEVKDFSLGQNITGVSGRYELLAPMALKDGSVIVYSDTETGWGSEDLDAVTITKLSAAVEVTNTLPLKAELVAYPLDAEGKRIPGVEVKAQTIEAGSTAVPVTIEMTGEIRYLDGIVFQAVVYGADPDQTLAPSQTITLKNIRARVSGWYEKEL